MGRLIESSEHGEKALALHDNAMHMDYRQELLGDPKVSVGLFGSQAAWMLGYPDRAAQRCDETVAYVRRFGHPFNLGWALRMGAEVFVYRGEPGEAHKRSDECERLGKEHRLPVLVGLFAPSVSGLALIREGRFAEGISQLNSALAASGASRLRSPYYKAVLGEGAAMLGRLEEALQLIEEAIEDVLGPGGGEHSHYAEILRLKGWALTLKDDLAGAEKSYLASLDWAREQQAKSWELRTSTCLARLWKNQGKQREAHDLLKPVYDWFTEGFDTKDLKQAKALLDKLEVTA